MLDLVANRTIDLAYDTPMIITPLRGQHLDMTLPALRTLLVVLSRAQTMPAVDVERLYRIFSTEVWLLLIAVRHRQCTARPLLGPVPPLL